MVAIEKLIGTLFEMHKDEFPGFDQKEAMYDLILLACQDWPLQQALDRLGVPEDSEERERDWAEEMLRVIWPGWA